MLKRIDLYIIGKFFSSYLLTLILFILIAIVFDISEKIESFIDERVPFSEIMITYYLNFIPYFAILFTPLFLFVAVIYFTSRMAYRSEIVAMMNSGITFNRLLLPYFFCAAIVTGFNILANHWIVPEANKKRIGFETMYIDRQHLSDRNLHMQVAKDQFVFVQSFSYKDSSGFQFSYEKFKDGQLAYKFRSEKIRWDSPNRNWIATNYSERTNSGLKEKLSFGRDTVLKLNLVPSEFKEIIKSKDAMNARELNETIKKMKLKGSGEVAFYLVEKYKRTAFPFAIFILTIMAVSLSSRKVRGGIGLQIGLGIALSFIYIFFQQFSQTFSTKGSLPPFIGVWIPNLVFALVTFWLYRNASRSAPNWWKIFIVFARIRQILK